MTRTIRKEDKIILDMNQFECKHHDFIVTDLEFMLPKDCGVGGSKPLMSTFMVMGCL